MLHASVARMIHLVLVHVDAQVVTMELLCSLYALPNNLDAVRLCNCAVSMHFLVVSDKVVPLWLKTRHSSIIAIPIIPDPATT